MHDDISLDAVMTEVESRLGALALALHEHDSRGVDHAATELQRALGLALDAFSQAAQRGDVPLALRRRLAQASGQVAAQRETLARASAALDRALDRLLPREAAVYNARGAAAQAASSGFASA